MKWTDASPTITFVNKQQEAIEPKAMLRLTKNAPTEAKTTDT